MNQRIRTPLAVGGEVTVFQVGVAVFKDGEREAGGPTSFGAYPVAALTELL